MQHLAQWRMQAAAACCSKRATIAAIASTSATIRGGHARFLRLVGKPLATWLARRAAVA
jgi:hypothetical protein